MIDILLRVSDKTVSKVDGCVSLNVPWFVLKLDIDEEAINK